MGSPESTDLMLTYLLVDMLRTSAVLSFQVYTTDVAQMIVV
jgi:hypothetical protein